MTDERKAVFLADLAKHGIAIRAARAASPHSDGACMNTFFVHRRQDPEFADAWTRAMDQAISEVESELHRRAVEGYEEPVYQRGEKVGTVRRYSDKLLELRVKALMPEKYRERVSIDQKTQHSGVVGVAADLSKLPRDIRDDVRKILDRIEAADGGESST